MPLALGDLEREGQSERVDDYVDLRGETTARATYALLSRGDQYMHLADLKGYLEADDRLTDLYSRPQDWTRKAILNVAGSGKFSSDRTIAQYAAEIWNVKPCPVK